MPTVSAATAAAQTPQREATAARLLKISAGNSYDPDVDIDWRAPLDPERMFAPEHRLSLYGTALWDGLTPQQRIELSKHEVASIASIGIWFEMLLMRLLLRHVSDQDPRTGHVQYALTEVGDECRHSIMFARMIEAFGAPAYRPAPVERALGKYLGATAGGVQTFAAALIAEEILDALQREAMADDSLQPLVRMVSRIHVVEEARHIRFARDELARQVAASRRGWAGRASLAYSRLMIGRAAWTVTHSLIHPGAYAAVGLDPVQARAAAWRNPVFRETLRWSAERVTAYLQELGLVEGPARRLWRASALI
ncbi:diiron oxygenase [Dactylosporangium sp. NBC_01737]|uniref:AurF N-oxygenase family protein n=1 Tax=Dactylosporangium sp. NBC_01737 TaxID=2975959 RepID=UPI002E135FBB|nr:diiron oxygenase [Dactylosporangium sp. NBC_01737]